MLSAFRELLTVKIPPLVGLVCTILILFPFLGPVSIDSSSSALAIIAPVAQFSNESLAANPIRRRVPRAAVLGLIEGAKSTASSSPVLHINLLRSCTKPSDGTDRCTPYSLNPVYDTSALPDSTPFVQRPSSFSPISMLVSLILLGTLSLIGTYALISKSFDAKVYRRPFVSQVMAALALLGWCTGVITASAVYFSFLASCSAFNKESVAAGEQLVATTGTGFRWLAFAFGLGIFPLLSSLIHVQSKGGGTRSNRYSISGNSSPSSRLNNRYSW